MSDIAPPPSRLRQASLWMHQHQNAIHRIQWIVVAVYAFLILVPAVMPLPDGSAHLWNNLTLAAQFVFWGIWWPFVLLSMVLLGRVWCGVLCPEGALAEFASKHGRGKAIPHWMRWGGWPFVAFGLTTIYGQMVSVYQYPKAVLLVLGGSTLAAMGIGLLYGREKRVWCKYLCPVNGVFALLARLAPVHFKVDEQAWKRSYTGGERGHRVIPINCAPLV